MLILKQQGELMKEISDIAQENKELRDELRPKNVVISRYEDELKMYRSAAFLDRDFDGLRKHQTQLQRPEMSFQHKHN
jgi:hypothetical protein